MSFLDLHKVSVSIGNRRIIESVCLSAEPGEIIALVGPNGAGKTTLLRAVAGLLPSRGGISVGGKPLATLAGSERARCMAYMQQGGMLAWPMRVRDVVSIGRFPHERTARARDDRDSIERALHACDIAHLAGTTTDSLSGGEKVRVMLARTLAVDAPILLLDEPVASLDPAQQLAVMDLLQDEAKRGKLVVIVLHDLALATRYATRSVLLVNGRVDADDAPMALIHNGALGRAFGLSVHVTETPSGLALHATRRN